jgi:hypothetical protein
MKRLFWLAALTVTAALAAADPAQAQVIYRGAYRYNPYTTGRVAARSAYNPYTGGAAAGARYYNPYFGRYGMAGGFYNPYTNNLVHGRAYYNPYTDNAGVRVRRW